MHFIALTGAVGKGPPRIGVGKGQIIATLITVDEDWCSLYVFHKIKRFSSGMVCP